MKKIMTAILAIVILAGVGAGFLYKGYSSIVNVDTIYDGISINDVDVSGLNTDEAIKKLHEEDIYENEELKLVSGDKEFVYSYKSLGYNPDYKIAAEEAYNYARTGSPTERFKKVMALKAKPLNIKVGKGFSDENIDEVVFHLSNVLVVEPVNATFAIVNGEKVTTPEHNGKKVDVEKTKKVIADSIYEKEPIEIPMVDTKATVTTETFKSFKGVLGNFSTNYSSSVQNRKDNIKLAASIIDGTVIMPNEQFSFNQKIGDISEETGFKPATVIENGEFITGTGGGICQVSTTLYNAVVRADIKVDERNNHSRPVNYVPMGVDAAVAEGFLDFKFTNSYNFPILIESKADDDNIEFDIIGDTDKKNYEIELIAERTKTLENSTKEEYTDELEKGEKKVTQNGNDGYQYMSYKIKKVAGEEVERTNYFTSYYPPRNTIVLVGTKDNSEVEAGGN